MTEPFLLHHLDGVLRLDLPDELEHYRRYQTSLPGETPADWRLEFAVGPREDVEEADLGELTYPVIDGVRRIRGRAFDLDPTSEGARVLLRMYHAAGISWVLRPWTAMLLLPPRGLLFHAAGLVSPEGRGYLCPGVSGAGKSTLSRNLLGQGWRVLSDELPAVRRDDDGWRLLYTPFCGDLGSVETDTFTAPLHGVLALEKGPATLGDQLDFGAAAAALLPTVAVYGNQPWFAQLVLDILAELTAEVGVRRLRVPAELTPGTVEGLLATVDDKG
ncbi:MAG: hypothetical protein GF399_07865 [Candidatus Coatesbacteria bacterium]|nr:hypothetical protein [Candidatus Coatesbacteria bacterium]